MKKLIKLIKPTKKIPTCMMCKKSILNSYVYNAMRFNKKENNVEYHYFCYECMDSFIDPPEDERSIEYFVYNLVIFSFNETEHTIVSQTDYTYNKDIMDIFRKNNFHVKFNYFEELKDLTYEPLNFYYFELILKESTNRFNVDFYSASYTKILPSDVETYTDKIFNEQFVEEL